MLKKRVDALIFVILICTVNTLVQISSFPTENADNLIFFVEYQDVEINDLPGEPQNWTWAKDQGICTGNGIESDPYIVEDILFAGTDFCFSILNSAKYFIITNCTISGNKGLLLSNVTNGQIIDSNIISNVGEGMNLDTCSAILVSGNNITDNMAGVLLNDCTFASLSNNNISNNNGIGISLETANNNILISENDITNNTEEGIMIDKVSFNNTIWGNDISDNTLAGISVKGPSAINNLFYENYFRDNTPIARDNNAYSNWNTSLIGNYWANYDGEDADGDGIGDTPFTIPGTAGNQDYLPIWDLMGPIAIDGAATGIGAHNWTWAASQYWCSGAGSVADPYVIEDLEIDAQGTGSCISIINSRVYFSIENCIVSDAGTALTDAGIYLFNVTNGNLAENDCSNNGYAGILLSDCNSSTVSSNIVNSNDVGIFGENSNYNTLSGNNINDNLCGINIIGFWNEISENTIDTNIDYGIFISSGSHNNTVDGNTVKNSIYGISVSNIGYNTISNNEISNNSYGVYLDDTDNNIISNNEISSNSLYGVYIVVGSNGSLVYSNYFILNGEHAVDYGYPSSNNVWNSLLIGNYWDNYTGSDGNNDGIGDDPHDFGTGIDYLPIWDDTAPIITINSPNLNDVFGFNAPNFDVTIIEPNLDETWYTLDNGLHNYTFEEIRTIDQSAWDVAPSGSITLTFYARDKIGSIGSAEVIIIKDVQAPTITINSPDAGDEFGSDAPSFDITVTDANLDTVWFTLNGGIPYYIDSFSGTINQTAWSALTEENITITFYANDSAGNLAYEEVSIIKIADTGSNLTLIIVLSSTLGGVAVCAGVVGTLMYKGKIKKPKWLGRKQG
ncbi:MAG: right-handed parallel beta-helix repeat-containing protein [Candidatus Heimdallarchaeota archaeon]|nr:right-handed parallel beta-helix repeat-containing protein [Candidatus Heimdallarchaeota archaeon]